MVEYGPLLPNQVVQLRTDTRRTAVVDLTRIPATADELAEYRDALKDLESFAPIANIGPTLEANASAFGVTPPQGNMHRLKRGAFTRPIPRKSPGPPAGAGAGRGVHFGRQQRLAGHRVGRKFASTLPQLGSPATQFNTRNILRGRLSDD